MRIVYRLIYILSALAIAGMTAGFSLLPPTLATPGPMKQAFSGDRSIGITHPDNWKPQEQTSQAVETKIEFTPALHARFAVTVDLQGSLLTEMLKSNDTENRQIAGMIPGGGELMAGKETPLEREHAAQGAEMKRDIDLYPDLTEGATEKCRIAGQEALITDCTWAAPGIIGGRPVMGRRATLLLGNHRVSVVYGCLKEMKAELHPLFQQMQQSIEISIPGGAQ